MQDLQHGARAAGKRKRQEKACDLGSQVWRQGGKKCSLSLNRSRRTVPIPVPGWALNSNSGVDDNSPRPPDPAQTKEEKPTPAPSQDPWLVLDIWVYSHVTDEETGSGICHVLDSATFTRFATHHNGGYSGNKQQQRGN